MTSTRPQLRACDAGMEHNLSQQGSDCAHYKYVPRNPEFPKKTLTEPLPSTGTGSLEELVLYYYYYYYYYIRSTFVTLCNDLNHFTLSPTTQHEMDGRIAMTYSIHCSDRSHSSLNERVRDNGI